MGPMTEMSLDHVITKDCAECTHKCVWSRDLLRLAIRANDKLKGEGIRVTALTFSLPQLEE